MTVQQLLAATSSAELAEWMAFDAIEPFGEQRADLRAGIVAASVVNHSMSPPKRGASPRDFMPFIDRAEQPADAPVLLADPEAHAALLARTLFGDAAPKKH